MIILAYAQNVDVAIKFEVFSGWVFFIGGPLLYLHLMMLALTLCCVSVAVRECHSHALPLKANGYS